MMPYKPVLVLAILLVRSFHQSQSSSEFNQSLCSDESVPSVGGTIVRGEVSPRDKWPWIVALVYKTDNELFGCGSLISERFVLEMEFD